MTWSRRVGQLYTAARDQGLDHGQAEELARNIAAALPAAVCDVAEAAIEHRVGLGWLPVPACVIARRLACLAMALDEPPGESSRQGRRP